MLEEHYTLVFTPTEPVIKQTPFTTWEMGTLYKVRVGNEVSLRYVVCGGSGKDYVKMIFCVLLL